MLKSTVKLIIGTLVLMIPAFYNGFPLVYSDTGTYIHSGMDVFVPLDRPIFYGIFIKIFSLGISLWPVIFFQALIVNYALWITFSSFLTKQSFTVYIAMLIPLSVLSPLGWYVSQIMPDIFAFTAIVSLFFIIDHHQLVTRTNKVILGLVFLLSILVHHSHLMLALVFTVGFFIYFLVKKWSVKKTFAAIALTITSIFITITVNYSLTGKAKLSEGSHVFLMGRMLDNGVLQSYLDDKCPGLNTEWCTYKDSLPINSRELLWNYESPIYKLGGWDKSSAENQKILLGIIRSPKHVSWFGYTSLTATLSQLFQHKLGADLDSKWYREPDSSPYQHIRTFFPHELKIYEQSRQNGNLWKQELDFGQLNHFSGLVHLISFIGLLVLLLKSRFRHHLSVSLKSFSYFVLLGLFANAAITASLANVYDRLQSRIIWLLPYVFILAFSQFYLKNHLIKKEKNDL